MSIVLFSDFDIVMAEELGNDINIHASHDEIAGKSGAEHFDTWFCT